MEENCFCGRRILSPKIIFYVGEKKFAKISDLNFNLNHNLNLNINLNLKVNLNLNLNLNFNLDGVLHIIRH